MGSAFSQVRSGNIVIGELRNRSEKPSFLSVEESHRRRAKSPSAIGYDRILDGELGAFTALSTARSALEGRLTCSSASFSLGMRR